jgi:uncharacterized protein YdeI (YjbR/CyaY-like superfamily)
MKSEKPELPVKLFKDQKSWSDWLDEHYDRSSGLWLRLAKKASDIQSVSYAEALEAALCYGWIDGQKKTFDESSWLQKFTPRGDRSLWSKVNREKAEVLIRGGRMKPAGLAAIERAKGNGRWEAAYDSPGKATVPSDFQAELDRNPEAKEFFGTLNGANRYAILWRIQTVKKAETRARRIRQFIGMLERKERIHG